MADEEKIKQIYGNVSLSSGPVDPNNPTFDSLLGALKAVSSEEMPMDVLVKYHKGLSRQLSASRKSIEAMPVPDEFEDVVSEQRKMTLASLDVTQTMLDFLEIYIKAPSKENLAFCVERLLNCQNLVNTVHGLLNKNIEEAEDF